MSRRSNTAANLGSDSTTNSDSENFMSPDPDPNDTDYNLERTRLQFSAANIQSFAKKSTSRPPIARSTRHSLRSETTAAVVPSTSAAAAAVASTSKVQRIVGARRRKQQPPLQREMRLLQEMRRLQNSNKNMIPRMAYSRLIREIMMNATVSVTMITRTALEALQEAGEIYLTQQLQDAYTLTLHRGRVTLMPRDMELLRFLRPLY